MFESSTSILYVNDLVASTRFYRQLLGTDPAASSPAFALFGLPAGAKLGLWSRHVIQPAATPPGGSEMAFAVRDRADVDQLHEQWSRRGIAILQAPGDMEFGYTFTAADPDGHRLRVYRLSAP